MKGPSGIERKLSKYGYIFILPFLLTYLAFQLWPIIYTILLSFSDLKGLRADFTLIGLENYKKLITDKYFWEAIQNTGIVWFFNFVPQLGIALLFALWFTDDTLKIKYKGIFRTILFLGLSVMLFSIDMAAWLTIWFANIPISILPDIFWSW